MAELRTGEKGVSGVRLAERRNEFAHFVRVFIHPLADGQLGCNYIWPVMFLREMETEKRVAGRGRNFRA